jgi:hypothetical protein
MKDNPWFFCFLTVGVSILGANGDYQVDDIIMLSMMYVATEITT